MKNLLDPIKLEALWIEPSEIMTEAANNIRESMSEFSGKSITFSIVMKVIAEKTKDLDMTVEELVAVAFTISNHIGRNTRQ